MPFKSAVFRLIERASNAISAVNQLSGTVTCTYKAHRHLEGQEMEL